MLIGIIATTVAYALLPVTFYNEVYTEAVLMLRGSVMYRDVINHHAPGSRYCLMPFYWVLPHSQLRFFLPLIAVAASTALLVHRVASEVYGTRTGAWGLCTYLLLQPLFNGHIFWLEGLNGLVAISIVALALANVQSRHILYPVIAGLLFGAGITIKQTFGAFAVVATPILFRDWCSRKYVALAAAVPLGLVLLANIATDSVDVMVRYAIVYNARLGNRAGNNYSTISLTEALGLFSTALVCLLPVLSPKRPNSQEAADHNSHESWLMACGIVSLIPLYPRFAWEHFQQALPFVAILTAHRLASLKSHSVWPAILRALAAIRNGAPGVLLARGTAALGLGLLLVVLCSRLYQTARTLRYRNFTEVYNSRPELEELRIAVTHTTNPSDRVYLWGSDALPGYVVANRMPAAGDIYPFPWIFDAQRCIGDLEGTYRRQQSLLIFLTDEKWRDVPKFRDYIEQNFDIDDFSYAHVAVATRTTQP